MLGLLVVVAILGVLAAFALSGSPGTTPKAVGNAMPTGSDTTSPRNVASGAQEATVAGCQANYATIARAIGTYRALNGAAPPAGTSWASATVKGGPFLQSWPSDAKSYTITWNGSTLNVLPVHGLASHGSYGTSSPASGCFAN